MSDWTVYRIDGERLEAMAADARRGQMPAR